MQQRDLTALSRSGGILPGGGGMTRHIAVGVNSEKGATTEIMAQVPSIWAKGCTLESCACVI